MARTMLRTWQPPQGDRVLAEAVALAGHTGRHPGPVEGALNDPNRLGRGLDLFGGQLPAGVFEEILQALGGLLSLGPLLRVLAAADAAEQVPHGALGLLAGAESSQGITFARADRHQSRGQPPCVTGRYPRWQDCGHAKRRTRHTRAAGASGPSH